MRTIQELFDLKGQVALVTGGAAGIGMQMSYALGEAGADLVIAARKIDRCREVADKMAEELGISVMPAQLDVGRPEDVKRLFAEVMDRFPRVDILVNNSGVTWGAPSLEYPIEVWEKVVRVNLTGTWLMCQEAAQIMVKQNYGRIINISSMAALSGTPPEVMDTVAYQASKAGVAGLTRDLAVKWAPFRITVNTLAPGWFPTKMTRELLEKNRQNLLNRIPLDRFGGEDELKAAVLFLASPGAGYCTGAFLSVDGGWTAQ